MFLTAVNVVFHSVLSYWLILSIVNIILIFLISYIVIAYESKPDEEKAKLKTGFSFLKLIRFWYPMIVILYIFKEIYLLVRPINPNDCDLALINIDYWIFGINPTVWIYSLQIQY